ncbi:unnamed protein product [Phytomonas sp. Hart1]|nr:unnamed protein product [Phytomonas sp. Hart1]|eukprot:CCW69226.1 unnamed protein product [Phytomonas sp. isolate Hart1]
MSEVVPTISHLVRLSDAHCHVKLVASRLSGLTLSDSGREIAKGATDIKSSQFEDEKGRTTERRRLKLRRAVLCGMHPKIDWTIIKQLAESSSDLRVSSAAQCENHSNGDLFCEGCRMTNDRAVTNIIVGFGVHPWYVPEVGSKEESCEGKGQDVSPRSAETMMHGVNPVSQVTVSQPQSHLSCPLSLILEELEQLLSAFPKAIVGEIGIDKLRGPCTSTQVVAFLAQMELAAKYHRPVSVHCVRHHGLLLQLLQELPAEHTPPAIILHGFTGSSSIAQSLLRLKPKKFTKGSNTKNLRIADRIFFSIGSKTTGSLKDFVERTLPLLCSPKKRILFESDLQYQICTHSSLSTQTREGDAHGCELQSPLLPHSLDVANSASIFDSLEEILDSISTSLVSTDLKDCQNDATNPAVDEEVVDLFEDVFDIAFATVL